MYTYARHRHATRWRRRLVLGAAILLNLWLLWRFYQAYQQARHPQPQPQHRGQLV